MTLKELQDILNDIIKKNPSKSGYTGTAGIVIDDKVYELQIGQNNIILSFRVMDKDIKDDTLTKIQEVVNNNNDTAQGVRFVTALVKVDDIWYHVSINKHGMVSDFILYNKKVM